MSDSKHPFFLVTGGGARNRRAAAGFTLLELIVVMTLLTVVFAVAAPRLGRFMSGREIDEECRRLLALTRYARSEAIGSGRRMELWIAPRKGEYGLRAEARSNEETRPPLRFELAEKLAIEIEDSALDDQGEGVILFWPDGGIDETSPIELILSEEGEARRLITLSENRIEYIVEVADDVLRY
jgi:type II secretion system protein H